MIWKSKFNQIIVKLADFFTVILGITLAYLIWYLINPVFSKIIPPPSQIEFNTIAVIVIIGTLFIYVLNLFNAYKYQRFTSLKTEYSVVLKTSSIMFFFSIAIIYLFGGKQISRTIYILSYFTITGLFFIQKTLMFFVAKKYRKFYNSHKEVLVLGTGKRTQQFAKKIGEHPSFGIKIIGLITADQVKVGDNYYGFNVIDSYHNIEEILKNINPQEVIITLSTKEFKPIRKVIEACQTEGVTVRLNSDFFSKIATNISIDKIYDLNIISFSNNNAKDSYLLIKRILDILLSLIAIILLSPVMLFSAIGILISDGFPILYRWKVMGKYKKPIVSWKFRTMVKNADELKEKLMKHNEMKGPMFKMENDPRIFKFGTILRKFSIDELPQLFSVLKGDLSLVGPRPPLRSEFDDFNSWHRRKLSVKPGLTCLWQVSGRNDIDDFDQWAKLDMKYIEERCLWLDTKILLKTIPAIIKGTGK